ncbi:MAG: Dihydrolipoyllysine-residue succinyltransferase component of 2-oxoglutarate dehydrogenase complex [Anaerolineae bacterium]|nr:Dihydrolipoyllysine-residue succinyltransferase component of 2-oxoglutarate dehydrogenase complex [Anaerolineae bacterium]
MAKEVIMPALGMAMESGVLLRWFKAEGEPVTRGEPLLEIETDKTTVEVEATASGILAQITARPGDEIPVGQPIALILAPGETAPQPASARPEVLASPVAARIAAEHNLDLARVKPGGGRIQKDDVLGYLSQQLAAPADGRQPASPKARRLAGEHNLELAAIAGSGPAGAVLAADVLQAAAARAEAPSPPVPELAPLSRMWQVMAQRLTESWQTVPHFYLEREVHAGPLLAWRAGANERFEPQATLTDLLVKLVAVALRRHPRLNAMWRDGDVVLNNEVNVGLAVAVEEGLLVPVIHQADRLGLQALAQRRQELVARAQAGKLAVADLQGGTFTVSNLGMFGVDAFNAIVNPPQAAILAVGRVADRVTPVGGQPVVQPMVTLTLSCDHRVVDGARGAQFLQTLAGLIEDPLSALD